jgi:hypothetical protein
MSITITINKDTGKFNQKRYPFLEDIGEITNLILGSEESPLDIDDDYLEEALEEIMYDEYLHAKFLRNYMLEEGLYDPVQHAECEKAYMKMLKD